MFGSLAHLSNLRVHVKFVKPGGRILMCYSKRERKTKTKEKKLLGAEEREGN